MIEDASQEWRLYDRSRMFMPPLNGIPASFFDGLPGPRSKYSPVIDQYNGAGTSAIYRKIRLPKKAKRLSLYFYYENFATQFNFGGDWDSTENQHFSIDVLKKRAPADTSNPRHIIETLFEPDAGPVMRGQAAASPQMMGWTKAKWKVKKRYRDSKVQLRQIVSVFRAPLQTGIDDVTVKKKKKR